MLHTAFCELVGIEHPIMQAAIWPATSPELVAAVSNAGGLGSLAAVFESAVSLRQQMAQVRQLTDRPFAINHVVPLLVEETFAASLDVGPAVISFALGDPGGLVERAHEAGARVIHQVHTARQAQELTGRGIDAFIAQGGEAGGQGLPHGPSTMILVPQVVDIVAPVPVLAAGGIADGRGLAAVLVLGAQGANIGTRFLASAEASAADAWKQAIVRAESEDAVRFETWRAIMPPVRPGAYDAVPRVLATSLSTPGGNAQRKRMSTRSASAAKFFRLWRAGKSTRWCRSPGRLPASCRTSCPRRGSWRILSPKQRQHSPPNVLVPSRESRQRF